MEFTVVQGDIAEQRADALVSAAGTSLMMDTGAVGTALLHAAGEEINEEAVSKGPIDLGEVAVTDAYDLDAEWVIHAAAAHFGGESEAEHIRDATRSALAKADELGCESLAMPAVGCGIAGFPIDDGAPIICAEIARYDPGSLADVRLVGYTDEEYGALASAAREALDRE